MDIAIRMIIPLTVCLDRERLHMAGLTGLLQRDALCCLCQWLLLKLLQILLGNLYKGRIVMCIIKDIRSVYLLSVGRLTLHLLEHLLLLLTVLLHLHVVGLVHLLLVEDCSSIVGTVRKDLLSEYLIVVRDLLLLLRHRH